MRGSFPEWFRAYSPEKLEAVLRHGHLGKTEELDSQQAGKKGRGEGWSTVAEPGGAGLFEVRSRRVFAFILFELAIEGSFADAQHARGG